MNRLAKGKFVHLVDSKGVIVEQKLFELLDVPFWPSAIVAVALATITIVAGIILIFARRSVADRLAGFAMVSVGAAVLTPVMIVIYDTIVLF